LPHSSRFTASTRAPPHFRSCITTAHTSHFQLGCTASPTTCPFHQYFNHPSLRSKHLITITSGNKELQVSPFLQFATLSKYSNLLGIQLSRTWPWQTTKRKIPGMNDSAFQKTQQHNYLNQEKTSQEYGSPATTLALTLQTTCSSWIAAYTSQHDQQRFSLCLLHQEDQETDPSLVLHGWNSHWVANSCFF
jgi:hypothetical protein